MSPLHSLYNKLNKSKPDKAPPLLRVRLVVIGARALGGGGDAWLRL